MAGEEEEEFATTRFVRQWRRRGVPFPDKGSTCISHGGWSGEDALLIILHLVSSTLVLSCVIAISPIQQMK